MYGVTNNLSRSPCVALSTLLCSDVYSWDDREAQGLMDRPPTLHIFASVSRCLAVSWLDLSCLGFAPALSGKRAQPLTLRQALT
jgi:hypothetical protein